MGGVPVRGLLRVSPQTNSLASPQGFPQRSFKEPGRKLFSRELSADGPSSPFVSPACLPALLRFHQARELDSVK